MLSIPKSVLTIVKNKRGIDKIPPICIRRYRQLRLWSDPEKRAKRQAKMSATLTRISKNRRYSKEGIESLRKHAEKVLNTPEAHKKRLESEIYIKSRKLTGKRLGLLRKQMFEEEIEVLERKNDYAGVLLESDYQEMVN